MTNDGAGVGAQLRAEGVGIGFERQKIAVRTENFVLVYGTIADFWKKQFPNAGRAARTHGMDATVPVVHVANNADAASCRRPDGEICASYACDSVEMGSELPVGVVMAALADEVKVEVG